MYKFDQEIQLGLHPLTSNLVQPNQGVKRYLGTVRASYNIGSNPNGGYLLAMAAAALKQLHPQHPDPLSITAHYQRPGQGDFPCEVDTQLLRTGKSLSTSRATLMQDGKARLEILASYGQLTVASVASLSDQPRLSVPAPAIPPPEQCIHRDGSKQGVELAIVERLDIRLHPEHARLGTAAKAPATSAPRPNTLAQVAGWVRFRDGRDPDPLSLLLFADAFPPAIFGLLGMVGWVPTVELTVQIRRQPAPGWIQAQFHTQDLGDGRIIEDGMLWDSLGQLVAQSRQLAMLLTKPKTTLNPASLIDLRSDTVTRPTPRMRAAMASAPVGSEAHSVWHEAGGSAANAGVQFTEIGTQGLFTAQDVQRHAKPRDSAVLPIPGTTLVQIENTHNRHGGLVWSQQAIDEIGVTCKTLGLKYYLDGAMRQVGMFAAACDYGLTHHYDRLAQDHAHAQQIAAVLAQCPGLTLASKQVPTNIVALTLDQARLDAPGSVAAAKVLSQLLQA